MCYVYAIVFSLFLFGGNSEADDQLDEAIRLLSISLDSASYELDQIEVGRLKPEQKALYHYIRADIDFKTNHLLKALINYLESLKYANEIGDQKLQHSMNKNIGRVFYYYNNHDLSIQFYQRSLDYTDIPDKVGRIHYNLGFSYYQKNEVGKAIDNLTKAAELVESPSMQARVLNYLGGVYTDNESFDKSQETLRKCISLNEESTNYIAYQNLGRNFQNQNRLDSAAYYYEKSLILDSTNYQAYVQLGEMQNDLGLLKKAESLYPDQRLRFRNIKVFYLLGKLTGETSYFDRYYEETKRFEEEREEALDILKSEYSEFIFDAYTRTASNEEAKTKLLRYLLILAIAIIITLIVYPYLIKRKTARTVKKTIEQALKD